MGGKERGKLGKVCEEEGKEEIRNTGEKWGFLCNWTVLTWCCTTWPEFFWGDAARGIELGKAENGAYTDRLTDE